MKNKTRARLYAFMAACWIAISAADAHVGKLGWALFDIALGWMFGMMAIDFFDKADKEDSK